MSRITCAAVACVVLFAWHVIAEEPVKSPDSPDDATLIKQLTDGDAKQRLSALGYVVPRLKQNPDVFLPAVIECATESDPRTRASAITIIGQQLIWVNEPQNQQAIDFAYKMSQDDDPDVRHACIYFCLSVARDKTEVRIDRLIELACDLKPGLRDELHRVVSGLRGPQSELAAGRIQAYLDRLEPTAVGPPVRAVELFYQLTGDVPERVERFSTRPEFGVAIGISFPFQPKSRDDVVAIMRKELGDDVDDCEILAGMERNDVFAIVLVKGLAPYTRVLKIADTTPGFKKAQALPLTPELREKILEANAKAKVIAPETTSYEAAFQQLYEQLGREYPSFTIKDIDWKKVGDELLPQSRAAMTPDEFSILCQRLVARLEDSHAFVGKGKAQPATLPLPRWSPGLACLTDDRDRPVIFMVQPGSPAAKAGLLPGMAIVSVNGTPAAEAIVAYGKALSETIGFSSERLLRHDAARGFVLQGRRGAKVQLEIEAIDGARRTVEVPATLEARYMPRLPVPIEGINDSASLSFKRLEEGIGYLYVRRISPDLVESLDRAVGELRDCRGLIVDVRGNSGGGFDAARAVRNFDGDDPTEPERPRYQGPIAVLIDARCISAGEGWISWFRARHRARFFGETTAGASARKKTIGVADGLFQVTYPVKAYTGFLDRPIERLGIEPDVVVRQNAAELSRGVDTVLQTARRALIDAPAPTSPPKP